MPTAAQLRSKVRAVLDDETSLWKQGTMWSDSQIDAALEAAQLAFVRYTYLKKQWHLISQLYANVYGFSGIALPSNYMQYASATVSVYNPLSVNPTFLDPYPAVLYIGWSGNVIDRDPIRYIAMIKNSTVEFKNGLSSAYGTLYYYRYPTKISGSSNHTEMIDPCYDAITYHAIAILQQKDWGQCRRALKNLEAVIGPLMGEPAEMYPENLNQNTDA